MNKFQLHKAFSSGIAVCIGTCKCGRQQMAFAHTVQWPCFHQTPRNALPLHQRKPTSDFLFYFFLKVFAKSLVLGTTLFLGGSQTAP